MIRAQDRNIQLLRELVCVCVCTERHKETVDLLTCNLFAAMSNLIMLLVDRK